jgi:HEAT repeat protein
LFVVNDLLSWPVQWISFLSAGLISGWILVAVLIKREYSRTFRAAIDTRVVDADAVRSRIHDSASVDILARTFASGDRRRILFALGLTAEETDARLAPSLIGLLSHSDPLIRRRTLEQLARVADTSCESSVIPLLHDCDPDVAFASIHVLCRLSPDNGRTLLQRLAADSDRSLAAAVCRYILQYGLETPAHGAVDEDLIVQTAADSGEVGRRSRRHISEALGFINPDHALARFVIPFLSDQDTVVRRNALLATARLQKIELVPAIVDHLDDARHHSLAAEALARFGPAILPTLETCLGDERYSETARLRLPIAIARFKSPDAARLLVRQMTRHHGLMRYGIVRALGKLRRSDVDVPLDTATAGEWMLAEAESYYKLDIYAGALKESVSGAPNSAARLLIRAIGDRQRMRLEQVFRIAGLVFPADDMYFAHRGATSSSRTVRARAIEYLDTVWDRSLKESLFPILEGDARRGDVARRLFHLQPMSRAAAIEALLRGEDTWLAACAAFVVGQERLVSLSSHLPPLTASHARALRESAEAALKALKE